jgi:hypothetical protein
MQPDPIKTPLHQRILSAFLRFESGPVKGACVMALWVGKGIYLPLTDSVQTLSWRLRTLMVNFSDRLKYFQPNVKKMIIYLVLS